MGYRPRKSPRGAIREFRKSFREKSKEKKRGSKQLSGLWREEKYSKTEREIIEGTLKRLHTLGSQKFGSFPFSEHFDRWLINIEAILNEFETHPDIKIDDQFSRESSSTLATIKLQLEKRRLKETSVNEELKILKESRNSLEKIDNEYAALASIIKMQKKTESRRINSIVDQLKREQNKIIRQKTGFFRGISKSEREQKEIAITEELTNKQRELEITILDFNVKLKQLREENLIKREPVVEKMKLFQEKIQNLETDGSLEERWFACEALIDTVNSFLQRKAIQPY